jgi:3-polyprenyl-4-hydroxybenzoate decarboxylase
MNFTDLETLMRERAQLLSLEWAQKKLDYYRKARHTMLSMWGIDPSLDQEKIVIELDSRIERVRKNRALMWTPEYDIEYLILARRIESGEPLPAGLK